MWWELYRKFIIYFALQIGVVEQLDNLNEPVEDSVFYKPFILMPRTITTEQRLVYTFHFQVQYCICCTLLYFLYLDTSYSNRTPDQFTCYFYTLPAMF